MITSKLDGISPLRVCIMLGASVLLIAASMNPFFEMITYPVRIFVTVVHEMCHALAAMFTGGSATYIQVNPDASGHTLTMGGWLWAIAFAGYLGTNLLGLFSLIVISKGGWKLISMVFCALCAVTALFSGFGSIFTTSWGITLAGFFIICIMMDYIGMLLVSFFSMQLVLNAFYDLKTLFILSGSGVHTDAGLMRQATGIFEAFWAVLWITIAIIVTAKAMLVLSVNKR